MGKELPKGWVRTTLGEFLKVKSGDNLSAKNRIEGKIPVYGGNGVTGYHNQPNVEERTIVIGRVGFYCGSVHLTPSNAWVTDNAFITSFSRKNLDFSFILYLLKTVNLRFNLSSTAQPVISGAKIYTIDIFLPPLPEQKRIVTRLDTLFGHLDTLKTKLDRIPELLKNFRQQVLTQAVTGKLTEEWREEQSEIMPSSDLLSKIHREREKILEEETRNGDKESKRLLSKQKNHTYKEPSETLPKGWTWTTLMESSLKVVDCHNKTAPYTSDGVMLLRTTNVRNGNLIFEGAKFIDQKTYEFWSKRCPPEQGDLLFTREAPMGEVGIVPENTKLCMGQRMMLIRTIPSLLPSKYLLYAIMSSPFQKLMIQDAVGSGVKHLRVGDVESLKFPLPPIDEQQEVVRKVDELFAAANRIESQYHSLKTKIDNLPQAILNKAFKGELVEQDENDEPASVLLERIRKEREKVEKLPKKKKVGKIYKVKKDLPQAQAAEPTTTYTN